MFLTVACGSVPVKRRDAYLALAVRKAVPFADPQWYVAWHGSTAMVWTWSRQNLDFEEVGDTDDLRSDTIEIRVRRCLPESLYRGEAREQGVELIHCAQGVEGRAWKAGLLAASAWWPQTPSQSQWQEFCRGAGVQAGPCPEAAQADWREQPWHTATDRGLREGAAFAGRYGIPAALLLVVLAATYQLGALAHAMYKRHHVESQIRQVSAQASDVISLRNRAETARAKIDRLLSMRPPATQLQIMSRALALLEKQHASIIEWAMPDPKSINVVVSMRSPDPRALVLAFQKSPFFRDVSANIVQGSQDRLLIQARVIGKQSHPAGKDT